MTRDTWSEWQVVQLDECLMRGIGPDQTAALIGKTKDEVCTKMRELGLLMSLEESPSTAPAEAFSRAMASKDAA
jgi:hypothetical protein